MDDTTGDKISRRYEQPRVRADGDNEASNEFGHEYFLHKATTMLQPAKGQTQLCEKLKEFVLLLNVWMGMHSSAELKLKEGPPRVSNNIHQVAGAGREGDLDVEGLNPATLSPNARPWPFRPTEKREKWCESSATSENNSETYGNEVALLARGRGSGTRRMLSGVVHTHVADQIVLVAAQAGCVETLAANFEASTGILHGKSKSSCSVATQVNLMDEGPSPKIRYPQNKTEPSIRCTSDFRIEREAAVLEDGFTGKIFGETGARGGRPKRVANREAAGGAVLCRRKQAPRTTGLKPSKKPPWNILRSVLKPLGYRWLSNSQVAGVGLRWRSCNGKPDRWIRPPTYGRRFDGTTEELKTSANVRKTDSADDLG
ncbi:hypothetical protein K438DRAFT_1781394 [Mycena galopus ATCC 62051]|nr:hypothetical protein K438DRAFT_1781394 [Mycena galopus ATCC 62051]